MLLEVTLTTRDESRKCLLNFMRNIVISNNNHMLHFSGIDTLHSQRKSFLLIEFVKFSVRLTITNVVLDSRMLGRHGNDNAIRALILVADIPTNILVRGGVGSSFQKGGESHLSIPFYFKKWRGIGKDLDSNLNKPSTFKALVRGLAGAEVPSKVFSISMTPESENTILETTLDAGIVALESVYSVLVGGGNEFRNGDLKHFEFLFKGVF